MAARREGGQVGGALGEQGTLEVREAAQHWPCLQPRRLLLSPSCSPVAEQDEELPEARGRLWRPCRCLAAVVTRAVPGSSVSTDTRETFQTIWWQLLGRGSASWGLGHRSPALGGAVVLFVRGSGARS